MDDSIGAFSLVLLALPGLAMIVVARTLFPPRAGHKPEMQQLLRKIGSVLILFALIGALIGVVGWIGLLGLPVVVIVLLMVVDRYRRGEHQSLLYTVAAGARRGIALDESARAFADENGGDTSTRATVLAESIERGMPLKLAVRRARLKLSTASKLAVRLGDALGDLGNVLFQSLDDLHEMDAALRATVGQLFYVVFLVATGSFILTFVMLRIVPVFDKMFYEFGLKLPAMTVSLIKLSAFMATGLGVLLLLIPVGIFFAATLAALYFVGWLPADLPVLNFLTRRYDNALVLRGLALCVRRKLALPAGLHLMSQEFPRSSTSGRLRRALTSVEQGVDWLSAMQRVGLLGHVEAGVIASAERSGNLAWALDEMADSSLRRYILRIQMLYQIAFPILVVILGGIVGYVVIALFLPLIALIQGLA
jgi:type II secretory pathway component PulF